VTKFLPRDVDVVVIRKRDPDGVDALVNVASFMPGSYGAALKDGGRVASCTNAVGDLLRRHNAMSVPTPITWTPGVFERGVHPGSCAPTDGETLGPCPVVFGLFL
jgi:hypothetical protein